MTRFLYDQFAKDLLTELLTPFGTVQTGKNLAGEVRQIDVLFSPSAESVDTTDLGVLAILAAKSAVFEPFRNAINAADIRSCMSKVFDLFADQERVANRENRRLNEADLPQLWILSPTISTPLLEKFRATPDENLPAGIYLMGEGLKTALVAIHQLPATPETLWLRILGKGTVQKQAIAQLIELPEDNPFRQNALELLYNLRTILEIRQNIDREDQEFIMELSPLYLERLENATQQGIQQGERQMVESLLEIKFGAIDEELSQVIDALIKLSARERSLLILQCSRDELLARLSQS